MPLLNFDILFLFNLLFRALIRYFDRISYFNTQMLSICVYSSHHQILFCWFCEIDTEHDGYFLYWMKRYVSYAEGHLLKWMQCWHFVASVKEKYTFRDQLQSFFWSIVFLQYSMHEPTSQMPKFPLLELHRQIFCNVTNMC